MVRKGKSKYCITGFPNVHDLEIRSGKYGDFLGCTQYFNGCNYTEPLNSKKTFSIKNSKKKVSRPSKASVDNLKKQTKKQAELKKERKSDSKRADTKSSEKYSPQFTIISKTEDIVCPSCGSAVNLNGKCGCS
tara:strand:- start:264 stop:662 length:399 start_codon:yes stop_codon:yes gene_type:complete